MICIHPPPTPNLGTRLMAMLHTLCIWDSTQNNKMLYGNRIFHVWGQLKLKYWCLMHENEGHWHVLCHEYVLHY
jgi:hypothetical protein